MRISFQTPVASNRIKGTNGYGYATVMMLDTLRTLGYEVSDNDPKADVQIAFNQPQHWQFNEGPYKIGYHPWESTKLIEGWPEIMNQCDEIWTPSPLTADWYTRYAGIIVPVHVYQHGIEHDWSPVRREPETNIKFLHVGGEASRKGGWDLVSTFRAAFNGAYERNDVKLTLKMVDCTTPLPNKNLGNTKGSLGRVNYINEPWPIGSLRDLFYKNDVFVYPSAGEGFGLTPLQALATGMPTITLPAWAPYAEFMDPRLTLGSKLAPTKWPEIHPGKMFRYEQDELIDRLRWVADNYDSARDFACRRSLEIHEAYDWENITRTVFEDLEKRLA